MAFPVDFEVLFLKCQIPSWALSSPPQVQKTSNANSSNPDPISYAEINPKASNKNAYTIPFNYSAVLQTYQKKTLAFNIKIVYETV